MSVQVGLPVGWPSTLEEVGGLLCPRCEGTGKCFECQGKGKIPCPSCQGIGMRRTSRGDSYPCRTCVGTGLVDCPPRCSSCEGHGQITARRQREISEKYAVRFDDYSPSSRVSMTLVALNVLVFALTFGTPQDIQPGVWGALVNRPDSLQTLQLWRFVTPMLVHVNFWHLALNSWFLACYCPSLEGAYGRPRFLALYLVAGVAGNVLSWLLNPPPYGVGASGALMGVGAAYVGLHYRWGYFDAALVRWWAVYLVVWVVLGFTAAGWMRVDNWGHLGGALGGLAYALLTPRPRGH